METSLDRIASGGSVFKLVVGEYGAGKTFFMNVVRGSAMERQLVVAHADLNPSRRLHATGGRYALCTMCIGVGQGIALVIERV